jgi:hypothetical protein
VDSLKAAPINDSLAAEPLRSDVETAGAITINHSFLG